MKQAWLKWLLVLSLLLAAVLWALDSRYPLPDQGRFSTVLLDHSGQPLRTFANAQGQWRYPIALEQLGENYQQLLLGYEDRWFFWHPGVNPLAMLRASWQNLVAGKVVSGGSTLTMQVARLLEPQPRNIAGKLRQILRALQLEWHLSKQQILQLYINLAPFGGTLSGVEAASFSYFGKPSRDLTDAEAALLAVLPQAPSRYRPDRYPERARKARDKVLERMVSLAIWPEQRVLDAKLEPVISLNIRPPLTAPLLARRLRRQCPDCERIESLIDGPLQQQLEQLARDYVQRYPKGVSAALLVMENDSGAVRSYVGSADFLDEQRFGHVDMVTAQRSPGSTLKPLLYGMAIEEGLIHSQSLLSDAPRIASRYRPGNFSGGFSGPVSAEQALRRSLNVPAVQLLQAYGPDLFAARLRSSGLELTGEGAKYPSEAMILGGVGTSLESLVGRYSALARAGNAIEPRLTDQQVQKTRYLMNPEAAWITWRMLAFNPKSGLRSGPFNQHWPLAWKTGTSYGYREAWAIGVSKRWTMGVWVGRPDGSAAPGLSGRRTAAPLLFKAYRLLQRGSESALPKPDTVVEKTICWPLGTSAGRVENGADNCLQQHLAWTVEGATPTTLNKASLRQPLWVNSRGLRVEPGCSDEAVRLADVALWPVQLEPWLPAVERRANRLPKIAPECAGLVSEQRALQISSVTDGARFILAGQPLSLVLQAQGGSGQRHWYSQGEYLGTSLEGAALQVRNLKSGYQQLLVVDQQGNSDRVSFYIER